MKRFLLVFAFLASLGHPVSAGILHESNVDGWVVGAYSDNAGQFSHCATSVNYKTGTTLYFHLSKHFTWAMGLGNTRWKLTPGRTFNVVYYIDAGPRTNVQARITSTGGMVSIPLADSKALFESFRRGHRLIIEAGGETIAFQLTNSATALAATMQCTQSYASRIPASPSPGPRLPASSGSPSHSAPVTDQFRTEATILAANILSTVGITGFRILPRQQIPPQDQRFDAVWVADGGLTGAVTIVTPEVAANADQVSAVLLALDAQSCKGTFASGRYPTPEQFGVGRLMTSCSEQNASFEVQYSIAPRPAGGFYVFGVTGIGQNSPSILDAGKRIHEAASRGFAAR